MFNMKAFTFLLSLFALFALAMSTAIPQVDDSTSASPVSVLVRLPHMIASTVC